MSYNKPKTNTPVTEAQVKELLKIMLDASNENSEKARKGFEKVEDTMNKSFDSSTTYYYYLLSITTACIGFAISISISLKIHYKDSFLLISLILWLLSFYFGMVQVIRNKKMLAHFSFYIQGQILKNEELINLHKVEFDKLIEETLIPKKMPLMYFSFAIFSFIIWYVIKLFTN